MRNPPIELIYDVPTTLNALGIRRKLGRENWSAPTRFGPDGWQFDHLDGTGRVIVTVAPAPGSDADWIHASISWVDHMPTYADLKLLHDVAFGDKRWAYQVFAPASDHVNIHERALHLYGRLDGQPALPDFTYGMGQI